MRESNTALVLSCIPSCIFLTKPSMAKRNSFFCLKLHIFWDFISHPADFQVSSLIKIKLTVTNFYFLIAMYFSFVFVDSNCCVLVIIHNWTHVHMNSFFPQWPILSPSKYWPSLLNHHVEWNAFHRLRYSAVEHGVGWRVFRSARMTLNYATLYRDLSSRKRLALCIWRVVDRAS
jgi:hypothetical protein